MKKFVLALAILALFAVPSVALAGPGKPGSCVTLRQGMAKCSTGHYLAGQPISVGFDDYGNNYQAHMFSGSHANNYLGPDGLPPYTGDATSYLAVNPKAAGKWYWPYRDVHVNMKWNDACSPIRTATAMASSICTSASRATSAQERG